MSTDLPNPVPRRLEGVDTAAAKACGSCSVFNLTNLEKLVVHTGDSDFVIALAGNPNTGKSTVFNALTGLRQHVGTWPGTTVVRAEGGFRHRGDLYKVIDLPGTTHCCRRARTSTLPATSCFLRRAPRQRGRLHHRAGRVHRRHRRR